MRRDLIIFKCKKYVRNEGKSRTTLRCQQICNRRAEHSARNLEKMSDLPRYKSLKTIDVINVYNVYKKILCKRVYYLVNVYLNKNHMSETKQNYDWKLSYSALRSNRSLIEFIGSRC